jgi:SAM-dependent methyltransferase
MCKTEVIEWFLDELLGRPENFRGKKVLEVGSRYVNGSVRPLIMKIATPESYTGADIEHGQYVDVVCAVENLITHFGNEKFDVVISTEMLEHVYDWKVAVKNMKAVLKPEGLIFLTTRSKGFPYHGYPHDYWRFEVNDIKEIFREYEILTLENEKISRGLKLKAKKPADVKENDLDLSLYNIATGKFSKVPRNITQQRKLLLLLRKHRLLKQVY